VALGEADAVFVAEQGGVEVVDGREAERALEENLAGSGLEQIGAADDLGDALVGVVDDAGKLVAGQADVGRIAGGRAAPYEEVAEIRSVSHARSEGLRAEVMVEEADGFAVGDAEAVVGCREGL